MSEIIRHIDVLEDAVVNIGVWTRTSAEAVVAFKVFLRFLELVAKFCKPALGV